MRRKVTLLVILFLVASDVLAQEKPALRIPDRIRLAEAFRLGQNLGEKVWKGWNQIPFAVLLVTPNLEFLVRHPNPSKDFTSADYDSLLKSEVYFRKRVYQPNLLATFPAVNGIPTIVVGTPENTSKTSSAWVVTLLHEHFHQLQMSRPTYSSEVESLGLARGDKTGMWMLNFPFPYDSAEVKNRFSVLARLLSDALQSAKAEDFRAKLSTYLEARKRFREILSPGDYNYFSFQLWQEGIAQYTENHIAQLAATDFRPSKEFQSLPDFTPFKQVADAMLQNILSELPKLPLSNYRRVAFYYVGVGEGMLLDWANSSWKGNYFKEKFFLERYFVR